VHDAHDMTCQIRSQVALHATGQTPTAGSGHCVKDLHVKGRLPPGSAWGPSWGHRTEQSRHSSRTPAMTMSAMHGPLNYLTHTSRI
jgi:hypothetical protein